MSFWWIWAAVAAALCVLLYFFLTAAKKNTAQRWLSQYDYAHRGLHDEMNPENSLAAFAAAMERGYAIELDVHLSKDEQVMVFHDANLERMTGCEKDIKDLTENELAALALRGSNEKIPTLSQVLKLVDGRVPLLIETKSEGAAGRLEQRLFEELQGYNGQYAVQSFSPLSMRWFYKHAPSVLRGQLSCGFEMGAEHVSVFKRSLVKYLLTNLLCRPNFISYNENGVGKSFIKRQRRNGIPILAWTVRSAAAQQKIKPFVSAIIFENFLPIRRDNI